MEPRIVIKPAFSVVGIWQNGNPSRSTVDRLWERLGERFPEIPGVDPDQGYGVHVKRGNEEKYLAGLMVRKGIPDGKLPEGMALLSLEAHAYAVFHYNGRLENMGATLEAIFLTWLPNSGYQTEADFYFEYFDDRFQPGSDDSSLFIYVPVRESAS